MDSPWQFFQSGITLVVGLLLVVLPGHRTSRRRARPDAADRGGFLEGAALVYLARAAGLVLVALAVGDALTVPAGTPGGQTKPGASGRLYTEFQRVDLYRGADPGVVFCIAEQDAETAAEVVRTLSSPDTVAYHRFAVVVSVRRYVLPVLRPKVAAYVFTSGEGGWRLAPPEAHAPLLAAAKDLCRGSVPSGR